MERARGNLKDCIPSLSVGTNTFPLFFLRYLFCGDRETSYQKSKWAEFHPILSLILRHVTRSMARSPYDSLYIT